MNFSEFAKILYPHIGNGEEYPDYVLSLIDSIMEEPSTEMEIGDSSNDKYNPLASLSRNSRSKIFNGDRQISKKNASFIYGHFNKTNFVDLVYTLTDDSKETLCVALAGFGINSPLHAVDEVCADIFGQILYKLSIGEDPAVISEIRRDPKGKRITEVPISTVYYQDGKLYIGGETITLPEQLRPPDDIVQEKQPYIEQLFKAYADALGKESVTKEDIVTLPKRYRENYVDQCKSYYGADYIQHSVREVFDDGENQFNILKEDAHEGIKETYWGEYSNGYARLIAVLKKITSTTLSKSVLTQIRNLIGNLEKKGVCHILVNDGTIESWVVEDD